MRKPSGNDVLKTLTEDQQNEIFRRLGEPGGTYAAVRRWISDTWSVSCSESALQRFYAWAAQRRLLAAADGAAEAAQDWLKDAMPEMSPDDLLEAGNRLYLALSMKDGNVKAWSQAVLALSRARNSKANMQKAEAALLKMQKADAVLVDVALSDAERVEKMRRIFGKD